MRGHLWFEFSSKRNILIFVAAVAAILIYWNVLVPGLFSRITQSPRSIALMIHLHGAWFIGWAVALFGKAQDLNLLTDYDFDRLRRLGSYSVIVMITLILTVIFIFSKL